MRKRVLGQATIEVLKALRDGHGFGLDIMQATGLPSGTVYPTLARLADRGLIESSWEDEALARSEGRPRRRYYHLNTDGSRALDEALTRLGVLLRPTQGAPSPRNA